ncbi:hypothetical protein [Endozoicomonas lisbonensis]|uniref:Uncharacterized protein n=1 Tax=Endozoicomonas lisbonensis TaxID=3120522 RepID=A0ABV2SBR3_9GAMM
MNKNKRLKNYPYSIIIALLLLSRALLVQADFEESFYECIYGVGSGGIVCNGIMAMIEAESRKESRGGGQSGHSYKNHAREQIDFFLKKLQDSLPARMPVTHWQLKHYIIASEVSSGLSGMMPGLSRNLEQKIEESDDNGAIRLLSEAISSRIYETLKKTTYTYNLFNEFAIFPWQWSTYPVELYALLPGNPPEKEPLDQKAHTIYELIRTSHGWGSSLSYRATYDTISTANFFYRNARLDLKNYIKLRNRFLDEEQGQFVDQGDLHSLIRFITYVLTAYQYSWLENQYIRWLNDTNTKQKSFEQSIARYSGYVSITSFKLLTQWLNRPESAQVCYHTRCYGVLSYVLWPLNRMSPVNPVNYSKPTGKHPYPVDEYLLHWYLKAWKKHYAAWNAMNDFSSYYTEGYIPDRYDETD